MNWLNVLSLVLSLAATAGSATTPETLEFINYGLNSLTVEQSTSAILANEFVIGDLEGVTSSPTSIYEDLKFRYHVGSFAEYSEQDALTIGIEFVSSLDDVFAAFGSLSDNRQQSRNAITEMQYHIYQVRKRFPVKQLVSPSYNEMLWTSNFINRLRILPQSYTTGDDLGDYRNFWNQFGTHVFSTVELGGIIDGILIADRCSIEDTFGDTDQYLECLNAQWKSVELDDDQCDQDVEESVADRWIRVRGGNSSSLNAIITEFNNEDQVTVYDDWLFSLYDSVDAVDHYQVVGGQADGIWKAIEMAIVFGDHKLNNASSTALSDDEWTAIAAAMESAFTDYAQQLDEDENTVTCPDAFNCYEGLFKEEDCQCTECSDVLSCCGLTLSHDVNDADSLLILKTPLIFVSLLVVCIF